MLKPIVGAGIVSLIVLSQSASALAVTVQDIPNPRRMNSWVADTADLLTPQTEAEIDRIATQLEAKNGSEIAVVTVPTTKPAQSSKAFATELFNTWKIGKRGKNNGVLFLISKGDRRTEIETGTGLTALLPNSKVEIILTQSVSPEYKQGKFNEGTVAGTKAIAQALSGEPITPRTPLASDAAPAQALSAQALSGTNVASEVETEIAKTEVAKAAGGWLVVFVIIIYFYIRSRIVKVFGGESSSDSDSSSSDSSSDSGGSDFGGGSSDGGGSGDSW